MQLTLQFNNNKTKSSCLNGYSLKVFWLFFEFKNERRFGNQFSFGGHRSVATKHFLQANNSSNDIIRPSNRNEKKQLRGGRLPLENLLKLVKVSSHSMKVSISKLVALIVNSRVPKTSCTF